MCRVDPRQDEPNLLSNMLIHLYEIGKAGSNTYCRRFWSTLKFTRKPPWQIFAGELNLFSIKGSRRRIASGGFLLRRGNAEENVALGSLPLSTLSNEEIHFTMWFMTDQLRTRSSAGKYSSLEFAATCDLRLQGPQK